MGRAAEKALLRESFLKKRKEAFHQTPIEALPFHLTSLLKALNLMGEGQSSSHPSLRGAIYFQHGSEVSLESFLRSLKGQVEWVAPKVNGSELLFYPYTYGKTPLVRNQWGIWEPASNHDPVALSHCHFVCVPGVAFDREGGRLGYGKGYYDRALQGYEGVKIGVAYAQQVSEKPLPLDDHDVLMDALVTEEFFLIFNERD